MGLFGGTFDPLHWGHINSALTVLKALDLDCVHFIPAYQSPFRQPLQGPEPEQRLEMVRRGVQGYEDIFIVDDQEIQRSGVSYTIETLLSYQQSHPESELFLIVGMDQFEAFDQWKDYQEILKLTHLVVTSRPGYEDFPQFLEDLPEGLRHLVTEVSSQGAQLTTGRSIHFCRLEDVDVSSTEIRRFFREKQSVKGMLPQPLEEYIRQQGLYEAVGKRIGDFEKFTQFCAQRLIEREAIDVAAFDLRDRDAPSEFTLIASGVSTRQAKALGERLIKSVKNAYGVWPQTSEGFQEGRWVVMDYGALLVHIFYDYTRQEYRLEELWKDASPMDLSALPSTQATSIPSS